MRESVGNCSRIGFHKEKSDSISIVSGGLLTASTFGSTQLGLLNFNEITKIKPAQPLNLTLNQPAQELREYATSEPASFKTRCILNCCAC